MTLLSLSFFLLVLHSSSAAAAAIFSYALHHRLSDRVRRSEVPASAGIPEAGSAASYRWLVDRDRVVGGFRRLSPADADLTFSGGNLTVRINKLGFLHYAEVSIGTPSVSFLVALDTGSDLFWVPCDCQSCAPVSSRTYGIDFDFSLYSPSSSLSSRKVFCNNTLCETTSTCGMFDPCPYKVEYISSDTSSSGFLVEDILYLTTENSRQEAVEARVIFGCGQVQTGSFLDSAAPNGLFGLGMEKISVPSVLASAGFASNSFSMCFANDGTGRIRFGDNGSSDQEETPFILDQPHPTYVISIMGMKVGNASFLEDLNALIDSGTSFTTLSEPAYTHFTESFNSQIKDDRQTTDQLPFEYCYLKRTNQSEYPFIQLITKGGGEFPIINPIIFVSLQSKVIYCLAVVKGSNWNIIGQNFMTGLRIVFDREKLVLGWKKFDCYSIEDSSLLPVNPNSSGGQSPPFGAGPSSLDPEAAKQTGNTKQISVMQPSLSQPLLLHCHIQRCLFLLSLFVAII